MRVLALRGRRITPKGQNSVKEEKKTKIMKVLALGGGQGPQG
jgi:hypothetical protein